MGSTVKRKTKTPTSTISLKNLNRARKEEVDLILQFYFFFGRPRETQLLYETLCNVEIGYSNGPIHTLKRGFKEIKVELLCAWSHLKTLPEREKKPLNCLHWVGVGWVSGDDENWPENGDMKDKSTSLQPRLLSRVSVFAFFCELHKRNLPRKLEMNGKI